MLEDHLTEDELRDFSLFHKVCSTHNNKNVYEIMRDDMIDRHGYRSEDELSNRYLQYLEFTQKETKKYESSN